MSKRFFRRMIAEGIVSGYDDPRLPTLAGVRRRGYPPAALINLCKMLGVAKTNSTIDLGLLEHCVREELNKNAPRVMGVLRPLRLVIDNYPEGKVEEFDAVNNPEDPLSGTRKVPFSRFCTLNRKTFARCHRPSTTACRQAERSGSGTPTLLPVSGSPRIRRQGKSLKYTAPMTRQPAAAALRTTAR